MEKPFTDIQVKILFLLSKTKFLTIKQIMLAGITKDRSYTFDVLKPLVLRKIIGKQKDFGHTKVKGSLAHIYFITEYGAEIISEIFNIHDIKYLKTKNIQFVEDYFHRVYYINFCILLDKWIKENEEREIIKLTHYFEYIGANRTNSKTKRQAINKIFCSNELGYVVADGLAFIDIGNKKRAFAIELHNTTSTKKVTTKLFYYKDILNNGLISERFGHDKASFILSMSITKNQKKLIINSFKHGLIEVVNKHTLELNLNKEDENTLKNNYMSLYHFSSLEDILELGFENAFTTANNEKSRLFI